MLLITCTASQIFKHWRSTESGLAFNDLEDTSLINKVPSSHSNLMSSNTNIYRGTMKLCKTCTSKAPEVGANHSIRDCFGRSLSRFPLLWVYMCVCHWKRFCCSVRRDPVVASFFNMQTTENAKRFFEEKATPNGVEWKRGGDRERLVGTNQPTRRPRSTTLLIRLVDQFPAPRRVDVYQHRGPEPLIRRQLIDQELISASRFPYVHPQTSAAGLW